jgi:uracil-DNA glycosylase family 4
LNCQCTNSSCPVWSKCAKLPTEVYPDAEGCVQLLFVGQGGGRQERVKKRPFVGPAGKRIRQQIVAVRKQLGKYIGVAFSNTIRDCPEGNRIPTEDELKHCLNHLWDDIKTLKALGLRCVVLLGNAAKRAMIRDSKIALGADRGSLYVVSSACTGIVPLIATYHPSGLLHQGIIFSETDMHEKDKTVIADIIKAYSHTA